MTDRDQQADSLVIERTFDAPVEVMWEMWTDPVHIAAWYGPDGARIPVAEMDVRVGGARRICMEMDTPDGPMRMWFSGEYREVLERVRLVYTEAPSDEHGTLVHPPHPGMDDGHPVVTEVRVEFAEVEGRTRLTMTHVGIPGDSPGATGWGMALDKLAARATGLAPS